MQIVSSRSSELRPDGIILLAAFLIAAAAMSVRLFQVAVEAGISDWLLTSYHFTYETEFLRRGLPGQLISTCCSLDVETAATRGAGVALSVYFAAFVTLWIVALRKGAPLVVALMLLTASAGFQHLAFDFGRFDIYLFCLQALILIQIRYLPIAWAAIGTSVFASLALLIHEAAMFLVLPLCTMFFIARFGWNRWLQLLPILTISGVLGLILHFGNSDQTSFDAFHVSLSRDLPGASQQALMVLFRSVSDNYYYTDGAATAERGYEYMYFALASFALLAFFSCLLAAVARARRWVELLLIAACLCPLLLFPFGQDHFRWLSAMLINLGVYCSIRALDDQQIMRDAIALFPGRSLVLWLGIPVAPFLGPIGVTTAFG